MKISAIVLKTVNKSLIIDNKFIIKDKQLIKMAPGWCHFYFEYRIFETLVVNMISVFRLSPHGHEFSKNWGAVKLTYFG